MMTMETLQRNSAEKRLRRKLIGQIDLGRWALLAVVAITLLNQLLLMFGVKYHFFFSASMPYYLNWLGVELSAVASVGAYRALAVVLTLALYVLYGACWLLSVQRREWLLAALVIYAVDTVFLAVFALALLGNPASCLLEVITHAPAVYALYGAYRASGQLSDLSRSRRPAEAPSEPAPEGPLS